MKSAKKSLGLCALSLVLCVALLVGTTFAWFTDSVTNKGNSIQAGSLMIDAYAYATGTDGAVYEIPGINAAGKVQFSATAQDLKADSSPIIDEELWEPGISSAKLLQVVNRGTLAAKIRLQFDVTDGGLQNALWFDFIRVETDGSVTGTFTRHPMSTLQQAADTVTDMVLESGQMVQFVLVYGMDEQAGNSYFNQSFSADVTIFAAQATVEADGFGNTDYDAAANYNNSKEVTAADGSMLTTEELIQSLNGEWQNVTFKSDVAVTDYVNIYTDSNLDFADNTVYASKTFYLGRTNSYGSAPVTASLSNGTYVVEDDTGRVRCEDLCNVTVRDMTFRSSDSNHKRAVQVYAESETGVNTYVFENCVFDNCYLEFGGASGGSYAFDIQFINCTFTGKPGNGGSAVKLDSYAYGNVVFDRCSFDITANGNATAAVSIAAYPDYVAQPVNVTLKDVTFNGTSNQGTFIKQTPVMLRISYPEVVQVTEQGTCSYVTDGVAVRYDGSVQ